MKHTPGPWRIVPEGFHSTLVSEGQPEIGQIIHEANARRIVACVNACEGINTKDLELGYVSIRQGNVPHSNVPQGNYHYVPFGTTGHASGSSAPVEGATGLPRTGRSVESCPHCGATPYIREAAPVTPGVASEYRAVCARCKR